VLGSLEPSYISVKKCDRCVKETGSFVSQKSLEHPRTSNEDEESIRAANCIFPTPQFMTLYKKHPLPVYKL
jgi:hypothetical protein